jgi:transcriptional regulator with XRE-family HTH domain
MGKKERLNEAVRFLKYKGIVKTQEDVAKAMGSSRSNISSALSGKESVLTDSFVARFCATFPHISYAWLLLGSGDMLASSAKTVNDRIRDVLKSESISLQTLGEKSGENFEPLQYYLDNDIEPGEEAINRFCLALNVNKQWIKSGEGDIYKAEILFEKSFDEEMRPRLPMNVSGHCICEYLKGAKRLMCDERPVIRQFPDYDFTMVLKNDSMQPRYWKGDEVACQKVDNMDFEKIEWGHEYVVDTKKIGPRLKLIYEKGSDFVLRSYDSEKFPDFVVPKSEVCALYRVVGMIRV